jgi:polyferredoxin
MKSELKKQFRYFIIAAVVALGSWLAWNFHFVTSRSVAYLLFIPITTGCFLGMYFLSNFITLIKALKESEEDDHSTI